ncbi:copper resistance protein B [Minwuia thermotolerans]|uniref:Copper resistance protein CopB n=1 Tax=Minwuia thermotolerans TaxID=2056226 RepID=A0A2M9G425_9PROT|nr:copper resistance protein B [Minwuia thermotolerans]PJK30426.1 copper resistance protein CopB [Minwuia thermotolerans]
MHRFWKRLAGALIPAALAASAAEAEPLIWGIQVEQAEYRIGEGSDVAAWDFDVLAGSDELKVVWRSEGEYATGEEAFETLENQLRLQTPVTDFFDAVAGVRLDTPKGPDRIHGVIGLHGLTRQWFEVDADLFVSDHPSFRFEVEYEGLITNRIVFVPSIEFDLPFTDDAATGQGAFGPTLEVGGRISYDLVDRLVSPYVGVHYERKFGETADLARADGEEAGAVFFVIGTRFMF